MSLLIRGGKRGKQGLWYGSLGYLNHTKNNVCLKHPDARVGPQHLGEVEQTVVHHLLWAYQGGSACVASLGHLGSALTLSIPSLRLAVV